MTAAELPSLTPAQVAALLRASPDRVGWLGAGSDHRAYALGEDRVVRLPRWPGAGEGLRREARLLAWLTARLPGAALPEALHLGDPAPLAPEGFGVTRRIPGASALGRTVPDPAGLGGVLGCWLADLHALNPQGSGLRVDLDPTGQDWRDAALDDLGVTVSAGILPEAEGWAARVQNVPDLQGVRPVPIHGDFAAEHVHLDGSGRLTGVLDWADAALGDPARDLGGLVHWGDPALLQAARSVYPASGAVWERAAWYALCRALGDLAFAVGEGQSAYLEAGRQALNGLRGWWTNAPPQS